VDVTDLNGLLLGKQANTLFQGLSRRKLGSIPGGPPSIKTPLIGMHAVKGFRSDSSEIFLGEQHEALASRTALAKSRLSTRRITNRLAPQLVQERVEVIHVQVLVGRALAAPFPPPGSSSPARRAPPLSGCCTLLPSSSATRDGSGTIIQDDTEVPRLATLRDDVDALGAEIPPSVMQSTLPVSKKTDNCVIFIPFTHLKCVIPGSPRR